MLGPSDFVGRLVSEINRVAKSNFNVVILGETGAGKEVVARAIHEASSFGRGPFVPVDCGAIPETLLEAELFGHERGAFTSANSRQIGKIEAAAGGTLFLDEISNLPLNSQAKLLRALQEKSFFRIGSNKPLSVETRVLVATNQDLLQLTQSGDFRADLYFRLSEFTIEIPPLRERRQDVLYLAKRFAELANRELQKNVAGLSHAAVEALLNYAWPGNVRELRSCIRRAVLLADSLITEEQLQMAPPAPGRVQDGPAGEENSGGVLPLREIVRRNTVTVERETILRVLRRTGGNKAAAARLLKIDYKTIHFKVRQYGIDVKGRGGV
jgi:two-component system nitrogen regulation response regulator GlnG